MGQVRYRAVKFIIGIQYLMPHGLIYHFQKSVLPGGTAATGMFKFSFYFFHFDYY